MTEGLGFTAMSALAQKQTFALQKVMSALPPEADILKIEEKFGCPRPSVSETRGETVRIFETKARGRPRPVDFKDASVTL
jgi:hypothetical protein